MHINERTNKVLRDTVDVHEQYSTRSEHWINAHKHTDKQISEELVDGHTIHLIFFMHWINAHTWRDKQSS